MKKQSLFSALVKCAGYILLFYFAQIIAKILLEVVVISSVGIEENFETVLASLTYETMLLSSVLLAALLHLIRRKKAFEPFCIQKAPASVFFGAILLGFGAFWLANVIISISSIFPSVQESAEAYAEQEELISQSGGLWLTEFFYTVIGAPVMEEWLFRGMVQRTLKKSIPPAIAIGATAFLFAIFHGNLYQMVFTLPFGLLLGYITHRFQSITPSVLLHIAFNFANYPIRLGLYMGHGLEDEITVFFYLAFMLFFILSLPLGIILLRHGLKSVPPPKSDQYGEKNMAAPEFMIVGLGNPEAKYARNRHNCGFLAIDYIAEEFGAKMHTLRFSSLAGESVISGKKVLLLKPQTYMNLSGKAVREAADFYKIPPENILVLFDDISFAPGIFRIREKGSAGGHNGIKSIISSLSTDAFPRVKIGVGEKPEGWELMNWVLSNPSPEDEAKIRATFPDLAKTASLFAEGRLELAAASFNGKMHG